MGGVEDYIRQRNQRREVRLARRHKKQSNKCIVSDSDSIPSFQTKNKEDNVHHPCPERKQTLDSYNLENELRTGLQTIPNEVFIETCQQGITMNRENILLSFMRQQGWACPSVLRHWTIGYKAEPIISLFGALPHRLRLCMAHALKFSGSDSSSSDCAERVTGTKMWESDEVHGFICARFDPATQTCLHVTANKSFAAIMGMHREELLTRFARHDALLPAPPLDCLRALLHGLAAARTPYRTRYYRLVPSPPGDGRSAAAPVLVRATAVRVYDRSNRIVEVRRQLTSRGSSVKEENGNFSQTVQGTKGGLLPARKISDWNL